MVPQNIKQEKQNWMILTRTNSKDEIFNWVFAHRNDDKEIYPLTVEEIAKTQVKDKSIQKVKDKYENKLVENIHVLCENERWVIPKKLQYRAVAWYHHYLRHTRLEEMLKQAMYWTGMRTSVRQFVKQWKTCQVNRRSKYSYVNAKIRP